MTATTMEIAQQRSTIVLSFCWLRKLPMAAANNKQSGGTIGKIRSIRFDGTNDITSSPPRLQAISQNISGAIVGRDSVEPPPLFLQATNANPIRSKLHGA